MASAIFAKKLLVLKQRRLRKLKFFLWFSYCNFEDTVIIPPVSVLFVSSFAQFSRN